MALSKLSSKTNNSARSQFNPFEREVADSDNLTETSLEVGVFQFCEDFLSFSSLNPDQKVAKQSSCIRSFFHNAEYLPLISKLIY